MNSRIRLIALVLGVVAFGGLLAAGYFFLAKPYFARVEAVEKAEREAKVAQDDLGDLIFKSKKLKELKRRSLPAGPDYPDDPKRTKREYAEVAKQEYEQALTRLLRDSGARNSTVNFIDAESNNKTGIPLIDPNGPKPGRDADPAEFLTYTQVVFKVDIPKADIGTIAEVLRRYYSLDLLHQITHLNIRQTGSGELGEDKRPQKERADLKVELTTRAIIAHDAPRRRSLTPAPSPLVGLVGGGGAAAYENSPSLGRQKPSAPPPGEILALATRDYGLIPAKDMYHGLLPEPDRKVVKGPDKEPDPPAKPDFREFIVFTTAIHTINGDEHQLELTIKDKINKEDYELILTQSGEKVRVKVYKYEYENYKADSSQRKKKVYSQDTLEITKWTMINKNNFTVYGVDTDGSLILGEKPTGLTAELPKDDKAQPRPPGGGGGVRPGGGGGFGAPRTTLPPPDPKAAVIGGLVVTAPKAEKFYRWKAGENLKQLVELSKPAADEAIRRAQTRFLPAPAVKTADAAVPTPDKGNETP